MDPRLDRLFASLEAQFGAAIDRAEEEAAADLALSFRQDLSLEVTLSNGGWAALTSAGHRTVVEVAKDHVRLEPGDQVVGIRSQSFEKIEAQPPKRSDSTLIQLLREEVRRGAVVKVNAGTREMVGRVLACGEEHMVLAEGSREFVIPFQEIRSIRFSPGGSADPRTRDDYGRLRSCWASCRRNKGLYIQAHLAVGCRCGGTCRRGRARRHPLLLH